VWIEREEGADVVRAVPAASFTNRAVLLWRRPHTMPALAN